MTKITGLIGYPVEHSLSPAIHAYWIAQHKLEAEYKLFTTKPARLRQTILHMRKKNVLGVNITVPHKQAVREYLDDADDLARRIGAVNTITNRKGKFIGSNTDAYGFIQNLKDGLGDLKPYLGHVVLLGAGGAARAVIVALKDAGATHITIINRTADSAKELAVEFNAASVAWEARNSAVNKATLFVNTTSLGMQGNPPLDIDLAQLPDNAAVCDIVYAPLETGLLKYARGRKLATVDGLGMLLYQAQGAFEQWHGIRPEVTPELRAHILKARP